MGMSGNFSLPPLLALLEGGIEVCAVVLPARVRDASQPAMRRLDPPPPAKPRTMLPVLSSSLHTSIAHIAWERSIPLWEVQRMSDAETQAVLTSYAPDACCVACFSLYIPRSILDIPRLGCLNVHPSLLPANRGPDPLFWTFRNGDRQTGVTIHLVDEGLDTGPIVAQERIDVPDGIRYAELEARCAELGGKLLARSIQALYRGSAHLDPQDESQSSYLPMPTGEDYVVPVAEWTARRVYNFVRGVASRAQPVTLLVDGSEVKVSDAVSYSHRDIDADAMAGRIDPQNPA
jgi:methionyl-tRNA formyltransferase